MKTASKEKGHGSNPPAPAGTQGPPILAPQYTCPMHPEVGQDGPGSCPKCGMALEPDRPASIQPSAQWTCPMHPEIVRSEPGTCPKCGMALEPVAAADVEDEPNPELSDMTRRFWIAAVLTAPLVGVVMGEMIPGISRIAASEWRGLIELALATPVCLWAEGSGLRHERRWKLGIQSPLQRAGLPVLLLTLPRPVHCRPGALQRLKRRRILQ